MHTPGPWTIHPDRLAPPTYAVAARDYAGEARGLRYAQSVVAVALPVARNIERLEDARLIAAAPAMRDWMDARLAEHEGEQHMGGECPCKSCETARAILRAVEG